MVKGKAISEDLRRSIVRMHCPGIRPDTISKYTDVSTRQIYRIINRFLTTGNIVTANQRRKTGRTRHLTTQDVVDGWGRRQRQRTWPRSQWDFSVSAVMVLTNDKIGLIVACNPIRRASALGSLKRLRVWTANRPLRVVVDDYRPE
ncbi:hypothetical protein C8R45DRAFT_941322 [Mycena sanguinolenta]|nr:hypothetical protein C8R45DRAFT_941322 [Mycena sanguinolenta]